MITAARMLTMLSAKQRRKMTSMDQRHTAPYSADMRWRVVWKRFSKQQTFLEIAKSLEIAPSTAHRIFTEFVEKGDVDPKGKRGPKPYLKKLDNYMEMFIIGLILETPSLYLKELCKKVEEVSGESVPEATICRLYFTVMALQERKLGRLLCNAQLI